MSTEFQVPEWLPVAEPPAPPPVDDRRVEALVNRFIAAKQDALFAAPDAFYRLSGADAAEAAPAAARRLKDLRAATLESAQDDGERAAASQRLDLHISDAHDGIDRHVAEQRRMHQRQILSERQALIQRAAELEPNNDDKIGGLAEANAGAAGALARMNGQPEGPAIEAARSAVWRTAIGQRLASGSGPEAIALFERVKDQLAPADRLSLDTPVQVARHEQAADDWLARETASDGPPLRERLDADPNLPPDAKYIVRAKVDARESASEGARAAKVQALDDEVRDAVHVQAGRPAAYRPGTFVRIADAYDAAGEPERAAFARRMAAQDAFVVPFAQASTDKQQRMINELPEGELRDTAIAIRGYQADAFARDAFAAGTALYKEVGPAVSIDDVEGRVRQARQIAQLRGGIPVAPFTVREIDEMGRTLATGSEREKQAVRARLASVPVDMRPSIEPRDEAATTHHADADSSGSARTFGIDATRWAPSQPTEGLKDGSPTPSGGQVGSPTPELAPVSPEFRTADAQGSEIRAQQEANERVTDRLISAWIASTESHTGLEIPPHLAKRLEPDQRQQLEELLEESADAETDPAVRAKIMRGLTNYNSQVRLKWAREPLYEYRPWLSPEDFAKVAALQNRLDPHTGRVLGSAPVPDDLQAAYDALAPDPDAEYSTIRATDENGRHRLAMPMGMRTFLKGLLDLFAAQKTGELTTDALESFAALHGLGGMAFGPRGSSGTLTAGGTRIELSLQDLARMKRAAANLAKGKAWEGEIAARLSKKTSRYAFAQQVEITTLNGPPVRVDFLVMDRVTKKIYIVDTKDIQRLRLKEPNQRLSYPELARMGGVITKKGKPGPGSDDSFPVGMVIPPTKVQIQTRHGAYYVNRSAGSNRLPLERWTEKSDRLDF